MLVRLCHACVAVLEGREARAAETHEALLTSDNFMRKGIPNVLCGSLL